MMRVLCVGECMVELTHLDPVTLRLGFAGDTYNAAVYLRRVAAELDHELEVGYLTGLGDDEYSDALQDKPPTAGQAVAGDSTRTSTAPGARALKAGPAGA